jgi:hypothetical protein
VALDAVESRPSEKIVLFAIAQLCKWETGHFDRPLEALMEHTGLCRRSVQEAVKRLRAKGWLLGEDRRQHGIRVLYFALDGPEGASRIEEEPASPFDDWRVEEILTWAQRQLVLCTGDNYSCAIRSNLAEVLRRPVQLTRSRVFAVGGRSRERGYGCPSEEVDGRDDQARRSGSFGSAFGDAPEYGSALRVGGSAAVGDEAGAELADAAGPVC